MHLTRFMSTIYKLSRVSLSAIAPNLIVNKSFSIILTWNILMEFNQMSIVSDKTLIKQFSRINGYKII